jgi:hypothetical protein
MLLLLVEKSKTLFVMCHLYMHLQTIVRVKDKVEFFASWHNGNTPSNTDLMELIES